MLKKVIIPVAGLGMRMLPATKSIPKEMLPINGKPLIQYIVEEAKEAGFKEIILVTHSSKNSIENHFDKSFELENTLEKRLKKSLLKEIKKISKLNVLIHSIRQEEPKGLGHAILTAKSIVGNDPFGIMLPDMLIEDIANSNFLKMRKYFDQTGHSSILLAKAKKSNISKYGIVKLSRKRTWNDFFEIENIIEKPPLNKAPSNIFAVGRYIFNNNLMDFLKKIKPDKNGEIQLSDAIDKYLKNGEKTLGLKMQGSFFDCGDKLGLLTANIEMSKKDPEIRNDLLKYLKNTINK